MAQADLSVIGPQGVLRRYLVSGGTQILHGEPLDKTTTLSSGVTTANTWLLANADTVVVATDLFGGIAVKNSLNVSAGTVREQFLPAACPVPMVGRMKGAAQTSANVDTLTELALLIGDVVLIDYNATGAIDGGELYTIKTTEDTPADTSAFELVHGNVATSVLEVVVHADAYRFDVTT